MRSVPEEEISYACNNHLFPLAIGFLKILDKPTYQPKRPLDPLMPYHLNLNLHSDWLHLFKYMTILKTLLNRKAIGILKIPNKILKACSDIILPHLSQIFNISLTTKCYPDSLKFAKVKFVYKGGDKDNLDNYRPISVLPTVARVFEKLINTLNQVISSVKNNGDLDRCIGQSFPL